MKKRVLSLFLVIIIVLSNLCVTVYASTSLSEKSAKEFLRFLSGNVMYTPDSDNEYYKLLTGRSNDENVKNSFVLLVYKTIDENWYERRLKVLESTLSSYVYDELNKSAWDFLVDTVIDESDLPYVDLNEIRAVYECVAGLFNIRNSNRAKYFNAIIGIDQDDEYFDMISEACALSLGISQSDKKQIEEWTRYVRSIDNIEASTTTNIRTQTPITGSGVSYSCRITFDSNCNDVSDYTYIYYSNQDNWYVPTMNRTGYIFCGWYYDSACTQSATGTVTLDSDKIFYAKWIKRNLAITLNSNCQYIPNKTITVDLLDNENTSIQGLTRNGYFFGGWYFDRNCTQSATGSIRITSDMTLYAKWVPQYNYTVSNGKATLTGFKGFRNVNGVDETDIIIPDTIDGYPVVKIGNNLFANKAITSVTISNNVTEIESYAFSGCTKITSINISNGVTRIGGYAFGFCPNLTSVTIPSSVTSIGEGAFKDCNNLKNVYITDIAAWLLCKKDLFTFTTPYNLYINKELATNVTIPYNVTRIEEHALEYCQSITSITIPSSVTSIGFRAFRECSNLKDIYITDFIAWLLCNKDSQFIAQPYNLYINKEPVTSITIPNSVTSISANAFEYCQSLASVTIPKSVTSIGDFAFAQCCNLSSISIPEGITSIGRGAFIGCISLTDITMPDSVTDVGITLFYSCRSLKNIKLSKNLTKIELMFNECDSLTSVTIPANITSIGDREFDRCPNLKNITVDGNNQVYSSVDGVLYNKEQTKLLDFPKGKGGDFIIPNGVTSIGDSLFSRCKNLTSVTIPDGVKNISRYAFYDCKNLTGITIPGSVTSVDESAFYNCDGLKNVYFSGTPEEWNNIQIGSNNTLLTSTTRYYAPSLFNNTNGRLRVTAFPGKYSIILASYNSDDSLYDVKELECQIQNAESAIMTIENPEDVVNVPEEGYIKAMLWDSLDSMKPLCEPEMILCNE